ncbi:MAG TPA: NfeD family protein [Thermopetrobacter sp.]|nr:NfeD family protein [Thermopetrobacter sp.]
MEAFLDQYGWWSLGLLLLIAEMIAPGIFLMWLGLAALLTGGVDWLFPQLAWHWQLIVFAAFAAALVFGLRPLLSAEENEGPDSTLNRRLHALIGRAATLEKPIVNGRGEVRIGDTIWRVSGPDLPAGATITVTGVNERDLTLRVEKAAPPSARK